LASLKHNINENGPRTEPAKRRNSRGMHSQLNGPVLSILAYDPVRSERYTILVENQVAAKSFEIMKEFVGSANIDPVIDT
jgi:hypothetical protein